MELPREILEIIADYRGPHEKYYKPVKNLAYPPDIKEYWGDTHLVEYMATFHLETLDLYVFFRGATENSALILGKFLKEKKCKKKEFIFPLFYGKSKVKEYIKKYSLNIDSLIEFLLDNFHYGGGTILKDLYYPLVIEAVVRKSYSLKNTWIIREIFSETNDDISLFEKYEDEVNLYFLRKNKTKGILFFTKQKYIYTCDVVCNLYLQRNELLAPFYLENTHLINDHDFLVNPHPDAVSYYISEHPEKISLTTFSHNKNPDAVEYVIKKYDEIKNSGKICPSTLKIIFRDICGNPAAVEHIIKRPELINYNILYNSEIGTVYEAHPEIVENLANFYNWIEHCYSSRDFNREKKGVVTLLEVYMMGVGPTSLRL